MQRLFRGVAEGTYWHRNDAQVSGFTAHSRGLSPSVNLIMMHIAQATVFSPYISLTTSLGIACAYAGVASSGMATVSKPGYVYIIDIPDLLPPDLQLFDPIKEIVTNRSSLPAKIPYHHEGRPEYLFGVIDPSLSHHLLSYRFDTSGRIISQSDFPSEELVTITNALRDAEVLAYDSIPANYVTHRINVP